MRHALLLAVIVVVAATRTGSAIFAQVPPVRVQEVPVTRVLENLRRNPRGLPASELERAIGRLHLIAYLRASDSVYVYPPQSPGDPPTQVVEGVVTPCGPVFLAASADLCKEPEYSLEPAREVPSLGSAVRPGGVAHLAAATAAYLNARALDPGDWRTRLALAFVFDEAGRREDARTELRVVVREGLKRLPPRRSTATTFIEWATHITLSEAADHLGRLAQAPADKRLVATLRRRLEISPPEIAITPVVIPLHATTSLEDLIDRPSPVHFDFTGQGYPIRGGWLTKEAGWLVWDPYGHADITSGFQLFGSVTWMAFWENGYRALATLDDDGSGDLSGHELRGLAVWCDRNGNGRSDAGEVQSLAAAGIIGLRYDHEWLNREAWISPRGVMFANGDTRPTWDWIVTGQSAPRRQTH